MDVFYGRSDNATSLGSGRFLCSGGEGSPDDKHRYFGGMKTGDLVFFLDRSKDNKGISTLWKLEKLDVVGKESKATFSEVFSFSLLTRDKFTRLDLFRLGIVQGNYIWKSTSGKGFYRLELAVTDQEFANAIKNKNAFETYIQGNNHFRNIVFATNGDPVSDKDIQLCKKGNSYAIYNGTMPFLKELARSFNSREDRYIAYIDSLKKSAAKPKGTRKKVKDWLETEGKTNKPLTILDLWDFFCSQQAFDKANLQNEKAPVKGANESSDEKEAVTVPDIACKNLIIYGIPGCGKSHRLTKKYLASFNQDRIIRTTFHPEYSNTDFVGQVRPVKKKQGIDYEVIPGPFAKALKLAFQDPKKKKVALVIEELNRGNAAAIFGDLFQLLDRDENGRSEYEIENETISEYLTQELGEDYEKIFIPSNLYLYATMNTSDQNVFKLDTAFKRRWEFERLTNKDTAKDLTDFNVFSISGNDVTWKDFLEKINSIIAGNDDISGDRQIGNFFYRGESGQLERFANKVLEYLYNDVFKYGGREDVFNVSKYRTFDEIYDAFIRGENVFAEGLFTFDQNEGSAMAEPDDTEETVGENQE